VCVAGKEITRGVHKEETTMNTIFLRLFVKFQNLFTHEEGQDLPEYALVIALICPALRPVYGL